MSVTVYLANSGVDAIRALQRHGNLFYYTDDLRSVSARERLARHLWMLEHSDVVLVVSDGAWLSDGFDVGLAYAARLPIVAVGNPDVKSLLHTVSSYVAPTIEEAVEWIAMNLCEPSFAGSDEEPPFLDLTDGYVRYLGPIPSAIKDDVVVASTEEHIPLPAPFLEYQDTPSPMYDSNKMLKIGGVI